MRLAFTVLLAAVMTAGLSFATERVGWVTDQKCANAGKAPSAEHSQCAQSCVKNGEAIVFYDELSGRVVKIQNPEKVKDFVGKKVTVVGELVGEDIAEISSVRAHD